MEPISTHEFVADWLSQPQNYPHHPDRVEQIQTHISQVFLAGGFVYKLKKPVRYDFLDFSTVSAREHACQEEVRLNRRLAADIYLDAVPLILGPEGELRFGGAGEVVDWLVVMRRLPTELTLDVLHRRGRLQAEHIDRLVAVLVAFYRSLHSVDLAAEAYRDRFLAHVLANRRELLAARHHLPSAMVQRSCGFQLQLLRLQPERFDERIRAGQIVMGHGDLRPEHICFSEPIAIFDCIEFNAEFRTVDVADELAFLAAECDFLGAAWVGPQILARYQAQSGDRLPEVLWDFYRSYRACVRAKVAALRADQLQGEPQVAAAAEAQRHLNLADQYAANWHSPLLLAVGGLAGTGKSTLAAALAEALGADLLRTDVIRRELFGDGPHSDPVDRGIYRREAREQVYAELHRRAAKLHGQGISVVLDGTFSTLDLLQRARQLATHPRGKFLAIECVCQPEVARARITQRLTEGQDASEARPEIHDLQRARWEAWPDDVPQVRVDTERPLAEQVECTLAALRIVLESSLEWPARLG
jgi:aminoglycoside phosphotransferase family enzyme/predicted kinase